MLSEGKNLALRRMFTSPDHCLAHGRCLIIIIEWLTISKLREIVNLKEGNIICHFLQTVWAQDLFERNAY